MRVLFTSLFFGLVAVLTLASHPPIDVILDVFGKGSSSDEPAVQDGPRLTPETAGSNRPTGLIPVAAGSGSTPIPEVVPEPSTQLLPVPEPEPTPDPESVPDLEPYPEPDPVSISTPVPSPSPVPVDEPAETAPDPGAAPGQAGPEISADAPAEPENLVPQALPENDDTPENRSYVRSLNLYAVYFPPGETTLPTDAEPGLETVADRLAGAPPGLTVIIGGHTDAHSESEDAWEIGTLRARAVFDALVAAGAPADRLGTAHYPAAARRPDPSDAWRDRRVEFHILQP